MNAFTCARLRRSPWARPPTAAVPALQLIPIALVFGDLLFHHPAADEAEAEEAAGVSRHAESRRPHHHDRRHLRPGDAGSTATSVQLQIADKVRIEVAKGAIGGYQGSRRSGPVAAPEPQPLVEAAMSNLRWKLITILAVFVVFFGVGVYPIRRRALRPPAPALADGQAAQARPRPQGRRASRPARADRRRAAPEDRTGDGAAAGRAEDAQHPARP